MTPDRLSELEGLYSGDLPVCIAVRELVAEVRRLREQVTGYRSRLEIDHVYRLGSEPGEFIREEVPEGRKIPDGIECRDATIALQDQIIKEKDASLARLRGRVAELERVAAPVVAWVADFGVHDSPDNMVIIVYPDEARDGEMSLGQLRALAAAVRGPTPTA